MKMPNSWFKEVGAIAAAQNYDRKHISLQHLGGTNDPKGLIIPRDFVLAVLSKLNMKTWVQYYFLVNRNSDFSLES